jgi:hypothetical protein
MIAFGSVGALILLIIGTSTINQPKNRRRKAPPLTKPYLK